MRELFEFVAGFEGDVPGAAPEGAVTTLTRTFPWRTGSRTVTSTATWPISTRSTCTISGHKGFYRPKRAHWAPSLMRGRLLLSGRDERSKSLMFVLECLYCHINEQE